MTERITAKFYLLLFLIGFIINLIWEINQMSYFAETPGSTFGEIIFYCSLASIVDGLTIITIYFLTIKFFKSDKLKFYLLTAVFGALIAMIFEYVAFYFDMWSYKETMPRVPIIKVGILPFIQLITLVPLSIFLTRQILREN